MNSDLINLPRLRDWYEPEAGSSWIYKTLKLLIKSGLASEILSEDGSARRYTHELAVAQCGHKNLVCKDCEAVIVDCETLITGPSVIAGHGFLKA
jgi:Fe2+ or Zn2+ uptake regulation protein